MADCFDTILVAMMVDASLMEANHGSSSLFWAIMGMTWTEYYYRSYP